MVEILSQAEIEALLSSLSTEESPAENTDPEPVNLATPVYGGLSSGSATRRTLSYEPYDFRRPDKFSKDQLRTMQMLHETFARLLSSSLSAFLRVSTHVDLVSVEQIPYDEYMRSLTNSIITVFNMAPLAGQAILEMEFSVVLSMIDRLLGGPGNMTKSSTVLTDIEKQLTFSIIEKAFRDLKTAWEGVAQFTPRRERMETQSQFIQIVPPNDTVVSILFEVKVGEVRGALSLCIPYLLLKPITSKLSAQRWFPTNANNGKGVHAIALAQRLKSTKVTCICRLGTTEITVRELLELRPGDTLTLERKALEEVDLLIGGHAKFSGKPGTSGRKVAMHINRMVEGDTD